MLRVKEVKILVISEHNYFIGIGNLSLQNGIN